MAVHTGPEMWAEQRAGKGLGRDVLLMLSDDVAAASPHMAHPPGRCRGGSFPLFCELVPVSDFPAFLGLRRE